MRKLLIYTVVSAASALFAACSDNSGATTETDSQADETALANEADSLGYYLGLVMAENIRTGISEDSTLTDLDPEKFGRGLSALLVAPGGHPGFLYGSMQGATIQKQVNIFRSVGVNVSPAMLASGFNKGMEAGPDDSSGTEVLDRLMNRVNNLIIRKKMLER